jgi:hypothetical protein
MRLAASGRAQEFARLPAAIETDEKTGETRRVPWIHGIAAGPDGSLYYAEQRVVRRIGADGKVSVVAEDIRVEGCERPPAVKDDRTGPTLRGLDVALDGTVYVAASGCSAVLRIKAGGEVSVVLRATDAWSPMGVAVSGDDLYVLECRYLETERREDWVPRVRKLGRDGTVSVVAEVGRGR